MKSERVTIGTRGSKLAMWQAEFVKRELLERHPTLRIDIEKIKTTGDKITDVPLAQVGGKGLFVKEIEEALLRGTIDIAVHSMKDVPTDFPEGLHLAAICERADPRDALIVKNTSQDSREESAVERQKSGASLLFSLPRSARIGTSSLRRSCQLLNLRGDLRILTLRGNLDTRLRKLSEGQFDAIVLAAAGMKRLGLAQRIAEMLPIDIILPAIGQGAIGIECRIGDARINDIVSPLNHPETSACVRAERAFLKRLEGGCQVPIAAHAFLRDGTLIMHGLVGSISGERIVRGNLAGDPSDAERIGTELAEDVLSRGAREILNEVYAKGGASHLKESGA